MIDYAYDDAAQAVFSRVGGKRYVPRTTAHNARPNEWDFGWVPPEDRTSVQDVLNQQMLAKMPSFGITGNQVFKGDKAALFELWSHPSVVAALGFAYPGTHQLTGSCVGAGGGNALFTLCAMEVVRLGDPEQITIPFWLYPYGKSRNRCGMRGRGEGSTGTAFADAVREDGVVDGRADGMPSFTKDDGLVWGQAVEMQWSDGAAAPADVTNAAKNHLVKTTAECKDADQVRDALQNGYPVTCASMWGGDMKCQVQDGVLLNKHSGSWSHQMSCQAWWDHSSLGELFWIQNQWGTETHGRCPSGAPGGGFWVKKADMEWITNNGEVFAFSQFQGFPAQELSWLI